jgi:c-di-GMP-binding flagellar brake protein YcgR
MSTQERITELKPDAINERRAFVRSGSRVAVKLRQCANTLFTAGRTIDLSMGGAAIELSGSRKAQKGDRIAIAFENASSPITCVSKMVGAEVVRIEAANNGRQRIGVRFDAPQITLVAHDTRAAA